MIYLGINWNLTALVRPAREKALKDREDEAKKLANKKLGKCSVDEIVYLFQNSKRADWESSLRANEVQSLDLFCIRAVHRVYGSRISMLKVWSQYIYNNTPRCTLSLLSLYSPPFLSLPPSRFASLPSFSR